VSITIRLKRGTRSQIDNATLQTGEPAFATDTNELIIQGTSGKVTIGKNADTVDNYHVDATGATTGQLVQFDTASVKLKPAPIYYNSSSGNVGIGTTTPAGKLEVAGSFYTATGEIKIYPQNTTTEGGQLTLIGAGSYKYYYIDNCAGQFRLIAQTDSGEIGRIIVGSDGNVAIGSFTPSHKLHVAGNIALQAGANAFVGTVDNYALSLRTNNTDRIVIDTSGRVGIGGVTSPQANLHIGGGESIYFGGGGNTYPTTPSSGSGVLVGKSGTSDFRLALQDGTGRVNMYWNAYWDSSASAWKYIISNEPACRFLEQINGTTGCYFGFYGAPAGTAGNTISWTQVAELASGADVWLSPRGVSSDFFMNSSGNVGIGTTSPSDKLHVGSGNIRLDIGYEIFFTDNGQIRSYDDHHRILFRRTENKLELREHGDIIFSSGATSGTETDKMVILANGNVGIGTTSPSGKLEVYGGYIFSNEAESGAGKLRVGAAWGYPGLYVETANKDLVFGTNSGGIRFMPSGGNYVYITSSGNVGIGTTSPAGRLDVAGSFYTATGEIKIYPQNNTTEGGQLTLLGAGSYGYYYIDNCAGQFRIIGSGEVGRFIIDSNGNVSIGNFVPSCKLDVGGDIRSASSGYIYIHPASSDSDTSYIRLMNTASSTNNPYIHFGYGSYAGICSMYMLMSDKSLRLNVSKTSDGQNLRDAVIIPPANNSPTGCIIPAPAGGNYTDWPYGWAGGISTWDICCSGIYYTTMNQRSDASIKTDVQSLSDYLQTDCLDVISCLRPIKYVYVDDPLKTNRFGFIAQDVSEVCPELVTIDTENKASLNYMDLIALLTKGIQELYNMVTSITKVNTTQ